MSTKKSTLNNPFRELGLELAKQAKDSVKQINLEKEELINNLNTEFVNETEEKLQTITINFIKNYENQLNQQISENFKQTNKEIIQEKNELYEDLLSGLHELIKEKISANNKKYLDTIKQKIEENASLFDEKVCIQLNERDQKDFQYLISDLKNKKVTLEKDPLNSIGGYILYNIDKSVVINDTIEEFLKKKDLEFRKSFFKIFEKFVDSRKSATELMIEHDLREVFELPKEFLDFIKNNNIVQGK
jgi:hypothetical protein